MVERRGREGSLGWMLRRFEPWRVWSMSVGAPAVRRPAPRQHRGPLQTLCSPTCEWLLATRRCRACGTNYTGGAMMSILVGTPARLIGTVHAQQVVAAVESGR